MRSKKLLKLPLLLLLVSSGLHIGSALAINTPRDLRGTEIRQNTVKWEWAPVAGAVRYQVTINGVDEGTTRDTRYYSYNLFAGEHLMHVRAVDVNGDVSGRTLQAKLSTSTIFSFGSHGRSTLVSSGIAARATDSSAFDSFSKVQGLSANEYESNDVRWQWDAVSGAAEYEVTVDGIVAGTTGSTEWVSNDLYTGTHSLTVKAVDDSGSKTVQSATLQVEVTGSGSGSIGESSGAPSASASVQDDNLSAPPMQSNGGDENASKVESFIDPASYNYSEVSNKSGYELVFSDEFNGTELNPYRWSSQLRWDGDWNGERYEYRVINGEDQFYVNVLSPDPEHQSDVVPVYNPFKFDGGRLAIQATINPKKSREKKRSYGKLDEMFEQQQFLSGVISTHGKFAQKFGYFEARIKIPSHVGTFPAFWLFHEKRSWEGTQRTEIDIMENLGHAPQYVYNSFHFFKNVTRTYSGDANFIKPKPSGQIYTGTNYSQDYHVYAVEWSPGKIKWLIDGEKVSELENDEANFEELYLKINLAMGGNWTNFPKNAGGLGRSSSEKFPNSNDLREFNDPSLEIDYVRIYKRK